MKLVVTIYEETFDAALDAIRALALDHDMIEMRAERFAEVDLHALRAATRKPIILTHRGARVDAKLIEDAIEAGIEFVDVEWHDDVEIARPEHVVMSHHDYEGMRDVESIFEKMSAFDCAHTKLAATPKNFAENERLLALRATGNGQRAAEATQRPTANGQRRTGHDRRPTIIGMGERGLYARILAPFRGSELTFVAGGALAAPGQLTLERALAIYGPDRENLRAERVFAIVGNPAGHSLSPPIHNALFREKGVSAAYTIASVESFDEITEAFLRGEPCGLSITAPFKEDAFRFAQHIGAQFGDNARDCGAVNTLVNYGTNVIADARYVADTRYVADNTDVDGFAEILREICGRDRKSVALVGAGGTARAALVALAREEMHVTIYNRTIERARALLIHPERGRSVGRESRGQRSHHEDEATGAAHGESSVPPPDHPRSEFAMEPRCATLDDLERFDGEIVINTLPPSAQIDIPLKPGMTYIEAAYGQPATGNRQPPTGIGQPAAGNGQGAAGNGQRAAGNGQRAAGNGQRAAGSGQRAAGSDQQGVQTFDGLDLFHAQAKRQHELFMRIFDGRH